MKVSIRKLAIIIFVIAIVLPLGVYGEEAPGITKDSILIGNTTLLTGVAGYIGQEGNAGFQVAIDQQNSNGGINGKTIKVISYDDAYNPTLAVQGTQRLIQQDNIFAWAGGIGTPNFVAVLPLLEQNGIPAIAPYAPAEDIGTMKHPLVFMIWTNFIQEYNNLCKYLIKNKDMGASKGVSFVHYQTDAGRDALKGTSEALSKNGIKLIHIIPVDPTEQDWASIALELKKKDATWVGMQIAPVAGGQLVQAMHAIGYRPNCFGQSDFTEEAFLNNFGDTVEGFYACTKIRSAESENPLVEKHLKIFKEATGKEMTSWNAIGYVQALVAIEGLKNMKQTSRKGLIAALEGIENFKTGFLPPISFGREKRQGVIATGIAQIQGGKVKILEPLK
jgi:branched-chain amino acid transport system substrate-binding protein